MPCLLCRGGGAAAADSSITGRGPQDACSPRRSARSVERGDTPGEFDRPTFFALGCVRTRARIRNQGSCKGDPQEEDAVTSQPGAAPSAEQLQDLLLESPGFTDFLLSLSTLAAASFGGKNPMMCAITVERNGTPATVASSGPEAQRLDEIQYSLHDGPCLTALRTAQTILVTEVGTDPRWAAYARDMSEENIRSVLAVPIPTDTGSGAALNCYSSESGVFEPGTVEHVQEYAASISNILRLALRVHPAPPYPEHLRSALQSRAVIDAAVALVMAQNRCSHDQALALISRASTIQGTRMHDIAADIIAGAVPDAGRADRVGEDPTGR